MDLFDPDPSLSDDDRTRLSHLLNHYGRLNEVLLVGEVEVLDLQRLVLLEIERERPRAPLIRRLVGCMLSKERARILATVETIQAGEGPGNGLQPEVQGAGGNQP